MTPLSVGAVRRVMAGALLCALAAQAPAQAPLGLDPTKALTQYGVDVWSTDQGLPSTTVNAILQTRDGYLWLGTHDGLARFDGQRFTVFNHSTVPELGNDGVRALCESRDGSLWIGTNGGGLARQLAGRFTRSTSADGLPADSIWSLHCDARDDSVWVGTNGGGLSRFRAGRFEHFSRLDTGRVISAIVPEPQGGVWLATQGDGLRRLRADGSWTALTHEQGLPLDVLNALALARDGTLWVGTAGAGVFRMRDGRVLEPLPGLEALAAANVARILEDSAGSIWIATNGLGLGRVAAGRLTLATSAEGLPGDVVYSLFEGREGTLWVGTNGAGLGRLRDGSFTVFGTREGLSRDFVYTAFEDREGHLWVGTAGGLDRLERGRFVHVVTPATVPVGVRSLSADAQGALWVGTYGAGVFKLHEGRWTSYGARDGLAHDNVRAVLCDRAGRVWAATLFGLSVLENGSWRTYRARDGLPKDSLIGLAEDKDGSLWIGTDGAGLCRLRDGKFEVFTTQAGLASNIVLALYMDADGVLWIGTNGGLSRFAEGRLASYTSADGLPSDAVTQVQDDGAGHLWLGTSRGVSRVSKTSLERRARGLEPRLDVLTFDRTDGMKSSQCTAPGSPAGLRSRDGRLWFATTEGIVVVDAQRLKRQMEAPSVAIEDVLVDGRSVSPAGPLVVPPGPARLEFRYTGVALLAPSRVSFRFQLEGFDDGWVEVKERVAQYTGVPPGDYVFRVSARLGDGPWNERPAAVAVRMQPRLYQTWPFLGGLTAALIGLVAAGHRLRVRRLEASERELQALVQHRTESLAEEKLQAERLLAATRAIGSTIDLTSVLALILAELQRVVPYDSASVQELRGGRLEIVGGHGFEDLDILLGKGFDSLTHQPNAEVLRRREPIVLGDAPSLHPGFATSPLAVGIRSWMGVPLLFGERVTGMLTVDKREANFYTAEHARVAVAFAAEAAVALENARLYSAARRELAERQRAEEQLRRQSVYLTSLHETSLAVMNRLEPDVLLEALVNRAAGLLQASDGFLYLETPGAAALELRVWVGNRPRDQLVRPGEGAVGSVWRSGQPLAISEYDTWEGRSPQVPSGSYGPMVAVPLRVGGRVAGALGLAHGPGSPWSFAEAEVKLLASFGQLASIALDNAGLFAREHSAREHAERLQAATRALSATIDLSAVVDLILYELRRVVPADSASVQELKGEHLEVVAGCGHAAAFLGHTFDPGGGDGRSQEVLRSRVPVIRGEAPYADGAFDEQDPVGLRSWMGVPLLFGDRVIGMLALNKREPGFYTPELAGLAQAFAAQAAVAIENARLYAAARDELRERTRAQQALQDSEERFRQLAENIDAVFFMRSVEPHRVLYVSPAYERLWGRPCAELYQDVGTLLESVHPADRDALRAAFERWSTGYELEYRILRPDGGMRWVRTRAFPVRGEDGRISRMAGIAEDVTDRKHTEQLRADLAHTIVHDLKNPLTAIMGCVEILSAAQVPGSAEERTLQVVESNSRRLLSLVETILDVARLESGSMPVTPERLSLGALVTEALELERPLAELRQLRLVGEIAPGLPEAWADAALMQRVLQNLIGNAIKFTPPGGTVHVKAERSPGEAGSLSIRVTDTGAGIPDDMRGRLFQKFAAGHQNGRGSGLGLLFCRLAVEAHGGRIRAESEPGRGATFEFTVPEADAASGRA